MKYNIIGKNIEVTKGLENAVVDKLHKLDKYFNEETPVQVMLSVEKQRHIIEITIPFNGQILRGEIDGKDMYAIIDDAVAIIERQVVRFKNKLRRRHRGNPIGFADDFMSADYDEDETLRIDRRKQFAVKPMDIEEAIMQMELVGHTFFVYRDAQTEEVNVVYKRKNGTYGLIEPVVS
ncbi:ribosome-associated translation inhibitor RaiA [Niameybacter massiliensis]|uniref:Ribosome hibernation promoting factor n=1 Tax=Holtiella tumoricola TaxID=3018743 RepID=A0AA42J1B3_9FIRM|nr:MULTISPECIES: ribosome-associated translation inhibitor RaiA [Lachnospirales]MDA3732215.1 ribosome-associated translation inhibitor RaiA [Holtiella tumoricola]